MNKRYPTWFETAAIGALLSYPGTAAAQGIVGKAAEDPEKITLASITAILISVIQFALGFAAGIGALFIVISGYQYILAAGNPEKLEKAKMGLTWAIGGFILSISAFAIVLLLQTVLKSKQTVSLSPAGKGVPSNTQTIIANLADLLFMFGGAIAVLFLVLGGYRYMTSQGNQDMVEKAKKTVMYAAIGLVLVFAAYLVIKTVIQLIK